jgi:hypothetical protein
MEKFLRRIKHLPHKLRQRTWKLFLLLLRLHHLLHHLCLDRLLLRPRENIWWLNTSES